MIKGFIFSALIAVALTIDLSSLSLIEYGAKGEP